MTDVGKVVFIGLLLVLGIGIAGYGATKYQEQEEMATTYEETEALILSSKVARQSGAGQEGPSFYPDIVFEYRVDGEKYRSSRVFLAGGTGSKFEFEDVVDQYEPGTRTTAYYDPDDPSKAYLVEQRTNGPLMVSGFGLLFALTGVLGVIGLFQD